MDWFTKLNIISIVTFPLWVKVNADTFQLFLNIPIADFMTIKYISQKQYQIC